MAEESGEGLKVWSVKIYKKQQDFIKWIGMKDKFNSEWSAQSLWDLEKDIPQGSFFIDESGEQVFFVRTDQGWIDQTIEEMKSESNLPGKLDLTYRNEQGASNFAPQQPLETKEEEPAEYWILIQEGEIVSQQIQEQLNPIEKTDFRFFKIDGGPKSMLSVPEGQKIICSLDRALGEALYVCENLSAMIYFYNLYAQGGALGIKWYYGPAQKINVLTLEDKNPGLARLLQERGERFPNLTSENIKSVILGETESLLKMLKDYEKAVSILGGKNDRKSKFYRQMLKLIQEELKTRGLI